LDDGKDAPRIARGEKAVEDGRVVTHAQAKQRMSRWLK
jgi:predicted transcriptional regulator